MTRPRRLAALALLAAAAAAGGCRREPPPPEGGVRLVLFLVVDQMRYEYLERFRPVLSGGLARLLEEGTSFARASHAHALTTTAPGHATLSTGRHPSAHGIVNNGWWDPEEGHWHYAVDDERYDRSPRRLLAPTLGDWLAGTWRRSKVFAASGKDRSAILLAGRRADAAFWYDGDAGGFTSSSYYPGGEPKWLDVFNDPAPADALFGTSWEPLPETRAAAGPGLESEELAIEELAIEELDRGLFADPFPHPLGGLATAPDEDFYHSLYDTPFLDALLARFAERLIEEEDLGGDEYVDFLGISFSALDTVGHDRGPNSPELLDTLLRLDRILGELLDFVDRRVGREAVVVSLSSDHGVAALPEYRRLHGLPGRRIDAEVVSCVQAAGREVAARFGGGRWVLVNGTWDEEALASTGASVEAAEAFLRAEVEACPGVERVWTRRELASAEAAGDPVGARYARSFHPERSPGLAIQFEEHFVPWRGAGTTHGSPHAYDHHVPWLLRLPGGRAGVIDEPVLTVDVAPTVAALAGIPAPAGLDGVDRSALLPVR